MKVPKNFVNFFIFLTGARLNNLIPDIVNGIEIYEMEIFMWK